MKSAHWQLAMRIVPEARALPTAQRPTYLDQACGGDAELQSEVEALLAADPERADFIDTPLLRLLAEPSGQIKTDSEIGSYRVIRELGRGGMGVVYLARRADREFEHEVAIKVLLPGMEGHLHRFRREIQILANLNHPGIAKLHDGGRTEDGHPYFLMEYIEGQAIDAFCADQQLSISATLELFCEVCAAVHYAHQNLVVHGDLKPRNILVAPQGKPKLLDFGVAKLLEEDLSSPQTDPPIARPMTLEYASPEQARNETLTTGTDVYSLGVILYKLLTGVHPTPFRSEEDDLRHAICEEPPDPPSVTVVRSQESESSESRISAPLKRRFSADLDAIVSMALRKAPQDRYSSVEQFAADLQRYSLKLPVLAREDRLLYRAGLFMKRNRVWVGAATAVAVLVIGFATRLHLEQKETARQHERAEQVSGFLTELFRAPDPQISRGENYTAREMLDRGARKIEKELQADPQTKVELLDTMAMSYLNLGMHDSAAELYRKALAIREETFESNTRDLAVNLESIAVALYDAGEYNESEVFYKRAIGILEQRDEQSRSELATILNNLGVLYKTKGRYADAEEHYLRALSIRERESGVESSDVATSLNNLAVLYKVQGRYRQAESIYRRVVGIKEKVFGTEHPKVAITLKNLAVVCKAQEEYNEAEALGRRALAIEEKTLGLDHPSVAVTLNNLGVLYFVQGDYSAAEELHKRALAIREEKLDAGHRRIAESLHNLALAHLKQGDVQAARELLERALEIRKTLYGESHPKVAVTVRGLAEISRAEKDYPTAESLYRHAISIWEQKVGPDHANVAGTLLRLGDLLHEQGDIANAKDLFDRGITIQTKVFGAEHPKVLATIEQRATLFGEQ